MIAKPVKGDTATLILAINQLATLPEGIPAVKRQGRTAAAVIRTGDTIAVYALADSLQRLVDYYAGQAARTAASQKQAKTEVRSSESYSKRHGRLPGFFITLAAGFVSGSLAMYAITKNKD